MTNPPTGARTLAWARPLTRPAAAALVLLGVAGVVAGTGFLAWSRFDPAGGHFPAPGLRAAILALAVLPAVPAVLWAGRWRQVAALAAVAVAAFGVLQVTTITATQGYGLGGPLTVLGGVVLAAGWLLGGPPVRRAHLAGVQRVPGLIVLVGTVVLVGFAGWGGQQWFTDGRFVDATTAGATSSGMTPAPQALDHQRWQRIIAADQLVGVAGNVVLVRDDDGVRALDPATGRERWHYLRSDLSTANATVSADGKTVVLFYAQGRGVLAVALDTATGEHQWTSQLDSEPGRPWNVGTLVAAGDRVGAAALGEPHGVGLVDLDSGDAGPEFPSFTAEQKCTATAVAAAGDTLAVATRCDGVEQVRALAAGSGHALWTWQPPYPPGTTAADPMTLASTGSGLLVEYGDRTRTTEDGVPVAVAVPRTAVLLDAKSGQAGPGYRVTGSLQLAQDTTAVYLDGTALGVDLGSGSAHWSTPLTAVAGYHPVATAVAGGVGYLALRGPNNDGRMNGDGGALGVVALNLDSGQLLASRIIPADTATCRAGTDGRTLCGPRPVRLAVGAGTVVLAEQRGDDLALTSLD